MTVVASPVRSPSPVRIEGEVGEGTGCGWRFRRVSTCRRSRLRRWPPSSSGSGGRVDSAVQASPRPCQAFVSSRSARRPWRFIGVFLVAERVRPAQRRPLIARGHRQDLLFAILNATLVGPLVAALTLSFSEIARTGLPVDRPAENRHGAALGRDRGGLRGDGRVQLVRPSCQSSGPRALALPRASPLPRGHERAHGLSDASPHSCLLSHRADPGRRSSRERRAVDGSPCRLRGHRGVRSTRIRTSDSDLWDGSSSVPTITAFTTSWTDPRMSTSASR